MVFSYASCALLQGSGLPTDGMGAGDNRELVAILYISFAVSALSLFCSLLMGIYIIRTNFTTSSTNTNNNSRVLPAATTTTK
jgi:hypothetical protein